MSLVRLAVSVVSLLITASGCVLIRVPATAVETSRTGEISATSNVTVLSVVFSPDLSLRASDSLGERMVECVQRSLNEAATHVRLVPQAEFYRTVFPGLEPREVLLRTDTLPRLLPRSEIRQRIDTLGLTHLILVGGVSSRSSDVGGIVERGVGVLGVEHSDWSRLTASLFELGAGTEVSRITAAATGKVVALAILPIPIMLGGGVDPEGPSCKALGVEMAQMLRGKRGHGTR